MNWIKTLHRDRKRRQRGSVLSGLLIIVALLSILIGAVMTEVTSSFLLSRALATRVARQATVTSAMELGISRLQARVQNRTVPANCAKDNVAPLFLSLNGNPATLNQITCSEIVPDLAISLAQGAFGIDGTHDTTSGYNRYLTVNAAGRLYSYQFGSTTPDWSVQVGGPPTAPVFPMEGSRRGVILLPTAMSGSGCAGHCVALLTNSSGGISNFRCTMPTSTVVTASPAAEVASDPNFPDYAFFAGSGAAGRLYVYDAASNGSCDQLASAALAGNAVGAPLVFRGDVSGGNKNTTVDDEIFILVTTGSATGLQHWRYREQDCSGNNGNCGGGNGGGTVISLTLINTLSLTSAVGGNAIGYAASSSAPPTSSTPLRLAVVSASGRLVIAQISVRSGPVYTTSSGIATNLPGGVSRPPAWSSQNVIGVGSTNGDLYLLSPGLSILYTYDGQLAINTTPGVDANGDWYFGASDGNVYDVQVPAGTSKALVRAASFPLGGVLSSPVVGDASDGCTPGTCVYFGSATSGAYFVQLGYTRVLELRACVTTALNSTTCAVNPRLWAKVRVGTAAVVGAKGVLVQGWSYYSP